MITCGTWVLVNQINAHLDANKKFDSTLCSVLDNIPNDVVEDLCSIRCTPNSGYERILLHADNTRDYAVYILNWTNGASSPIHDHPSNGCCMKVLVGQVCEEMYSYKHSVNDEVYTKFDVCRKGPPTLYKPSNCAIFISNQLGAHKITEVSQTPKGSITLHIYSPSQVYTCLGNFQVYETESTDVN